MSHANQFDPKEHRQQTQKFAKGVMYFVFPVSSYIGAVLASYPMAVFTSVKHGTGAPPEGGAFSLPGVIVGLCIGYWVSKRVYKSLTSNVEHEISLDDRSDLQ